MNDDDVDELLDIVEEELHELMNKLKIERSENIDMLFSVLVIEVVDLLVQQYGAENAHFVLEKGFEAYQSQSKESMN